MGVPEDDRQTSRKGLTMVTATGSAALDLLDAATSIGLDVAARAGQDADLATILRAAMAEVLTEVQLIR